MLCEQIGRRLVAAPFLPTVLALGALAGPRRGPTPGRDWREALGEGGAVGASPGHRPAVYATASGSRARCA